jgi:tetrahydromethanopterin S-methyltransferase subunit E
MNKVVVALCAASVGIVAPCAGLTRDLERHHGPAGASPAGSATPDPAAVALLVQQINAAIAGQPAGATYEQIEGAVAYVLQNNPQPKNVVLAAIAIVLGGTSSTPVRFALRDIQGLKLRQGDYFGTGALSGQNSPASGYGPNLSPGGGSDYIS